MTYTDDILYLMSKSEITDYSIYDNKPINSPFRWPGGKFYARKLISDYIPQHSFYIEPYLGGGSVFFYKNKTTSFLNDLDEELVNCYIQIRDNLKDFLRLIENEKASKDRHNFFKNEYKPKNDLERAKRFYYLNRTSYSGIMNRKNCYWGYGEKYSMKPENWPRQIIKNHIKLRGVKISSINALESIENNLKKDTFVFLDPPYFNADQDKFYQEIFTPNDHKLLAAYLKEESKNFKFLLTYDDCEEIRELYSWTKFIDNKEWNYVISRTDDQKNKKQMEDGHFQKRNKGKEIFISNYS